MAQVITSGTHIRIRDGVQAMERLKSAYLLAVIALAAVPEVFGQSAPRDSNAGTVAVVGDIEHYNTYLVPTDSALTVQQAVINAGLLSESANVTVIRSAQDHTQWTQFVSPTSVDKGERVESGDVLVVQSMSPVNAAVKKNAALRTNSGVVVVCLEQDGIVIGDVLKTTNNLSLVDGQLKIIFRFPGQAPILNAKLHHPIAHGDVISISHSHQNHKMFNGLGNMLPTVSEWKSGGATVARDLFIPNGAASHNSSFTSSQPAIPEIQLPSSPAPQLVLPIQHAESPAAQVAEFDKDEVIPTALVPVQGTSQLEDIADTGAADAPMSFVSKSAFVAPIAPQEMQMGAVTTSTATAFNPWNLVFIGGLLLAGILILAGTLKPEPDDSTERSNAASRPTTFDKTRCQPTIASQQKLTESERQQHIAMPVSQATETPPPIEPAILSASAVQPAKALVAGHEWFSGDWHGPDVASDLPVQGKSLIDETATVTFRTDRVDIAVPSSKTLSADEQGFSDLEDLLQNRLPIDLCEAQFPLRIALFGKPAGPRRLRIDAAHPAVPAPHINLSSDKRREQPAARTTVAAGHTPDTRTQTAADSSGGLDRALHFLQERTDS